MDLLSEASLSFSSGKSLASSSSSLPPLFAGGEKFSESLSSSSSSSSSLSSFQRMSDEIWTRINDVKLLLPCRARGKSEEIDASVLAKDLEEKLTKLEEALQQAQRHVESEMSCLNSLPALLACVGAQQDRIKALHRHILSHAPSSSSSSSSSSRSGEDCLDRRDEENRQRKKGGGD